MSFLDIKFVVDGEVKLSTGQDRELCDIRSGETVSQNIGANGARGSRQYDVHSSAESSRMIICKSRLRTS